MSNRKNLLPITITILICGIIGYLSIEFLGEYGWTVFALLPFIIGFLPPYILSQNSFISRRSAYKLGLLTLGVAYLALLVFALEGIICLVMASPFVALFTLVGSYIAFIIQRIKPANQVHPAIILLVATFGCMSFDTLNQPTQLLPVKTTILVNAPIEEVWNNVVTFNTIAAPTEWIFKTGISYPTDATIEGTGVGAIRYCNFTTGSFVEPITAWEAPTLLQFDVKEQPIPMNELNPFWEVHPPHLDGYFKSYKGQFKLVKLSERKTELEGTTWYKVDITPELYWKSWSNFIIHRIHERVLNHIKEESEKNLSAKYTF